MSQIVTYHRQRAKPSHMCQTFKFFGRWGTCEISFKIFSKIFYSRYDATRIFLKKYFPKILAFIFGNILCQPYLPPMVFFKISKPFAKGCTTIQPYCIIYKVGYVQHDGFRVKLATLFKDYCAF